MNQGERDFRLLMAGHALDGMTFPTTDVMRNVPSVSSYTLDYLAKCDAELSERAGFPTTTGELRAACGRVRVAAALN